MKSFNALGTGQSRRIPSSSTTTSSTKADISQRGNSRRSSPKSFARDSRHFAHSGHTRPTQSLVAKEFAMETHGLNRRRFCGAAAAAVAAGTLALPTLLFSARSTAMNAVVQQKDNDRTAIRPFRVNFPDAKLADLRKRINATIWPEKEPVPDA